MKNKVLAVAAAMLLSSCATYAPLDQIPVKNEDFKLPPASILEQFPGVAAHHEENADTTRYESNNTIKGSLSELNKKWGFPKKSSKELSSGLIFYGYTPFVNALLFWPYFEYIVPISAIEMIAIGPTKQVKWKKDQYTIDATFSGRGKSHLLYWKWFYTDEKGNEIPLIREAIKRWFVGFSVTRGYELLDNDVSSGNMKMARGGEVVFGREIGLWSDDLALDTKVAVKIHGDGISETSQRLMYVRAHWDLGLRYYFNKRKFSTGLGIVVEPGAAYKLSQRSYLAQDFSYEFMKPAVGGSIDFHYRQNPSSSIFLRAEYLNLKSKSSSETIDASNVAVGMRYYF